ncbi:MAG: hypothetical protein IJN70_03200 [Clostridia bacterium]|nr:hypothetical protein [Clostridia bacterium]
MKNKHHDYGNAYVYLAEYFTQYENVKVNTNNRGINRFLVFDKSAKNEFVNMTADNMADGSWITAVNQEPSFQSVFASFIEMMKLIWTAFIDFMKGLF